MTLTAGERLELELAAAILEQRRRTRLEPAIRATLAAADVSAGLAPAGARALLGHELAARTDFVAIDDDVTATGDRIAAILEAHRDAYAAALLAAARAADNPAELIGAIADPTAPAAVPNARKLIDRAARAVAVELAGIYRRAAGRVVAEHAAQRRGRQLAGARLFARIGGRAEGKFGKLVRWWTVAGGANRGETFLEVRLVDEAGRRTDVSFEAEDAIGPGSWVYGDVAYLELDDADRFLEAIGSSEQEVTGSINAVRRPNGFDTVRDGKRAAAAVGDDSYFADLEAERYAGLEAQELADYEEWVAEGRPLEPDEAVDIDTDAPAGARAEVDLIPGAQPEDRPDIDAPGGLPAAPIDVDELLDEAQQAALEARARADVIAVTNDVNAAGIRSAVYGDVGTPAVLESLEAELDRVKAGGSIADARGGAGAVDGQGRQAAAQALPEPTYVYASELLDLNTCGPCGAIDGTEWPTIDEARAFYPDGNYVLCEGGPRCRGTLVFVWDEAEAEPEPGVRDPRDGAPPSR